MICKELGLQFNIPCLLLLALATACAPEPNSIRAAKPVEAASTPAVLISESATTTEAAMTDTLSEAATWPVYTLAAGLPEAPAQIVFPMWQFYGTTDDGRELTVLWPAMQAP